MVIAVLFIEKGRFHELGPERQDPITAGFDPYSEPDPETRLEHGWWPFALSGKASFGDVELFAPWGCGAGGTSALYAAQLERFDSTDFRPRANFPGAHDAALPERWPISYDELVPYYRRAEQLYRVCGTADPLNPDPDSTLVEPPSLSERDQVLFDTFRERGLHPYRAHVGYRFVDGCTECGAAVCPRSCKSDSAEICLRPALRESASILPECEVVRLDANRTSVESIECRWNGRDIRLRAKSVVLAAGAYVTPTLLLKSTSDAWPDGLANSSGLVGRNLMLHSGDFIAVRPGRKASIVGPNKAISFNDFYFVDGKKLGTFQSVGIPVSWGYVLAFLRSLVDKDPRWWRKLTKPLLRPVAIAAAHYFRYAAVFATIVEDLPYHDKPDRARPAERERFPLRIPLPRRAPRAQSAVPPAAHGRARLPASRGAVGCQQPQLRARLWYVSLW